MGGSYEEVTLQYIHIQAEEMCSIVGKKCRKEKHLTNNNPSGFFLRSSSNRVDLLLYVSRSTDKLEQYDWMAEKYFEGKQM